MNAFEVRHHFFFTAVAHAPLFRLAAVEGHHQVVLFTAAQRIVHQVAVRASPQHRRVDAQVFRHIVAFYHRAVHHVTGDARRIAKQTLPHHGFYPVAANQNIRRPAVAFIIKYGDIIRSLTNVHHMGGGAIFHPRMLECRFPDRGMDIHTVNNRIRAAEVIAERLSRLDMDHLFTVDPIHHRDVIGKDRTLTGDVAHAQAVERGKRVRPQLDPGANFADLVRPFQQHHLDALTGQRQRGGRTANTAADNDCTRDFCHDNSPFLTTPGSCPAGFPERRR